LEQGQLLGAKSLLRTCLGDPKLQLEACDLAMFNLAIDSKLKGTVKSQIPASFAD
jgi:hypothetical protein